MTRLVRNIHFLAAALLVLAVQATAQTPSRRRSDNEPRPALYRAAEGWRLDFPPAMEDALDRYDRDFELWTAEDYRRGIVPDRYDYSARQVPWAVIGDFNGDGRADAAVAGRTEEDVVVILLLSNGKRAYRAVELSRDPFDPDDRRSMRPDVLQYLYPGRYVIDDPRLRRPRELVVELPAIQLTGGRRPGPTLFVVDQNKAVPYYLSDAPAPKPSPRAKGSAPRGDPRPRRDDVDPDRD